MTKQQNVPKGQHQHSRHANAPKTTRKQQRLLQTSNCHIGIIGSGLAGLSTALAILRSSRSSSSDNDYDASSLSSPCIVANGNGNGNGNGRDDDDRRNENNRKKNITNSSNTPSSQAHHEHPFQGKITIYERDTNMNDRKEGYGMTLTYDPNGPLAKLGVLEEVAKRDCPSRCHYLFNERGEIRGYFGNAFYGNDDSSSSGGVDGDDGGNGGGEHGSRTNETDGVATATKISCGRGAGQRGNLRIPRSELRSVLLNALMAEAAQHCGRTNATTGDDNHVDDENSSCSSRVQIVWNKRLLSYQDQPMMQKLSEMRHGKKKHNVQHCNEVKGDDKAAQQTQTQRPVQLHFEDGTTDEVDLLIGADGVNSVVARQYLSTSTLDFSKKKTAGGNNIVQSPASSSTTTTTSLQPKLSQTANAANIAPRYVGIFIILGISDHFHPLIDERGFHTLDGGHRLFIMPFQGSRLDDDVTPSHNQTEQTQSNQNQQRKRNRRTMWQLSYPISNKEEATRLSQLSHEGMQAEVLKRCRHWHAPFPDMVKDTPLETIWGTSLLDRDPRIFLEHRTSLEIHGRVPSRVVVLGDAAHSMTPFKGQGANQAFADGPLLAKWLSKSKLDSAIRGFMTEMANRSGIKVRASREAAMKLHSEDCWEWMLQQDKPRNKGGDDVTAVFHGVQTRHVSTLLRILKERGVGASLGSKLDDTIRGIIKELDIADAVSSTSSGHNGLSPREMSHLQSQSLESTSVGNMSQLRQISRKSHLIIPNALDAHQHTCLHLAAKHGHVYVCRWLLSEANVSIAVLDANGKSPLDLAIDAGNEETARLLKRWIDRMGYSCENNDGVSNSSISAEDNSNSGKANGTVKDFYRHVEQQLRGIRTEKQLRALLLNNRGNSNHPENTYAIRQVLGCQIDETEKECDRQRTKALAEEHGAVLLRNFIPREVDQLALGALALRPMDFDLSRALDSIRTGIKDISFDAIATIGSKESISKSEKKRTSKRIEETKSQMMISAHDNVIVQTNFGPQMQSYSEQSNSASSENAQKKRKIDSFPLSRLRYINLGEWNYNWGDRRYDKVRNASVLPDRIVSLAQRAHEIALRQTTEGTVSPVPFDMAICNLYHLHRPSDRLGGHQDNVESNLSLPLVTISLGAPGIFLLGGSSRNDVPTAILLRAGDCMVMSGKSRGYFHGLPTILSQEFDDPRCDATDIVEESITVFPELNNSGTPHKIDDEGDNVTDGMAYVPSLKELRFVKAFLATVRMNMSIRQV